MGSRELQHAQVGVERQLAKEMHAREVHALADFFQEPLPPCQTIRGLVAIRGVVLHSGNQNPRLRPLGEDFRQGTHEDMKSPVRLHVAVHKSQNLLAGMHRGAIGQGHLGLGIRANYFRIDPLVLDQQVAFENLRKQ